ncbi:MAG: acyl-CoA thioesterase [Anaerolineae bacterium]|nr:acyl-CoA thioesterase [Anaerolineae bacterium]
MHETLAGYPVVIELPVQWGDMDALRHVNNTVYLRYFESARIALFNQLDYQRVMHDTGVGPILHSISCRFKFPLTYPDTVWVGVRVTEIAEDRFTVHHIVVSQRHGRLAAEGDGIIVTYDYRAHHKTPIPDVWRQPIEAMAKQT